MDRSDQGSTVFVSDAVNAVVAADIADDMVATEVSRVLIIYTGGTIGMKNTPSHGYIPVPGYLSQTLSSMIRFHDPVGYAESIKGGANGDMEANQYPLTNAVNIPYGAPFSRTMGAPHTIINGTPVVKVRKPALITPPSLYGKRIRYSILEYDPLLDSSNMTMVDWVKIATDVEVNYALFDAFIVLHGTDTMAYTASALSFMLEELGKTVILSGSQVPLAEVRNDAVDNLLGALTVAGHFVIPEVGLFFNNKLYRGNRSSKVDAVDFNAFDSPNLRALITVGINIDVAWMDVLRPTSIAKFRAHKVVESSVATLRLFPGITETTVKAFLSPPIKGVVLETYGSGNAPNNRPDILAALKEASDRGVVIVNCTQCKRGLVTASYATGKALLQVGVVPGSDMTPECALTKLSYLLGKKYSVSECRNLIQRNLRGELTVPSRRQQFTYQQGVQGLVTSVMALLGHHMAQGATPVTSPAPIEPLPEENVAGLERVLIPMLLCQAAKSGDIHGLEIITANFSQLINQGDYDGRTALHIASSEDHVAAVEFLLLHGASVHLRDRHGHSALWDAVRCRRRENVRLLKQAGAHFAEEELEEAAVRLMSAIAKKDVEMFQFLIEAGADMNRHVYGRTPLHMATQTCNTEIVRFIVESAVQAAKGERTDGSSTDSPPPSPLPHWHRPASPFPLALRTGSPDARQSSATSSLGPPSWAEIDLEPLDCCGKTPLDEAHHMGDKAAEVLEILEEGINQIKSLREGKGDISYR